MRVARKRPTKRGLDALLAAIVDGDARAMARTLSSEPELARVRVEADRLVESIPHWLYVGDTALHLAASALDPAATGALLNAGADAQATNRRRATALHYACDPRPADGTEPTRQTRVIELLLAHGADGDAPDAGGATPLHRAVRARSPAAVRALLAGGASVTARLRPRGVTPLHLAVRSTGAGGTRGALDEQVAIVALLLEAGADPHAEDAAGLTPIDAARSPRVVAALRPGR